MITTATTSVALPLAPGRWAVDANQSASAVARCDVLKVVLHLQLLEPES